MFLRKLKWVNEIKWGKYTQCTPDNATMLSKCVSNLTNFGLVRGNIILELFNFN